MIILCGGEKGGCAKSTTAMHLAGEFVYLGNTVGILDADQKPSAKNWSVTREHLQSYLDTGDLSGSLDMKDINDIPKVVMDNLKKRGFKAFESKNATGDIIDTIVAMSKRNDILIIDVGGGDTEELRISLSMCDLAIMPLNPSILDYDTVPKLVRMLKLSKANRPSLKVRTLISNAPTSPQSNVTRKFKAALAGTEILNDVFKVVVKTRDSYKECLNYGLSARDWKDSSAKAEFSALAQECLDIMKGDK